MGRHLARRLAPTLLLLGLLGCEGSGDVTAPVAPGEVTGYISGVSLEGSPAAYRPGSPPPPGAGPAISVEGNATVVNGGSALVAVEASAEVARLVIEVEGADGYWDLAVPSGLRSTGLRPVITIAREVSLDRFVAGWSAAGAGGELGPLVRRELSVVGVGSGDLQVSLGWTVDADLDLHVLEPPPDGDEVYYLTPLSAAGGELDLDSNRACSIDGINNENATWEAGETVASGTYTVRVNLWDACGRSFDGEGMPIPIDFMVTVNTPSGSTACAGSATGLGNQGGEGFGEDVATVDIATGAVSCLPAFGLRFDPPAGAALGGASRAAKPFGRR